MNYLNSVQRENIPITHHPAIKTGSPMAGCTEKPILVGMQSVLLLDRVY